MQGNEQQYEYFAFISYKREDEKWAKWLQRKLEYYKLPSSIRKGKPDLPEKIRPVFKDTTDLGPGFLAQKIQDALNSSKFLIVICSTRSANSVWVSKEVQSFIDSGRTDHIIPFIIGGTPNATDPNNECFPEGLRQLVGDNELLGVNINEMGPDAAAIKVIARMFNLRFDTLWQRHKRNASKQKWSIRIAVSFIIAFLCVVNRELDSLNVLLERKQTDLLAANDSITAEKDRIRKVSVQQSLALAESKIREGDVGYALTLMTLVKDNEPIINQDNVFTLRYNEAIRLLADSLSRSGTKLIDIIDTKKDSTRACQFQGFS